MRASNNIAVLFAVMLVVVAGLFPATATAQPLAPQPDLVVCATCPVTTLAGALEAATPGSRIEVRGGVYPGPVVIGKDVELIGVDNPVIDGGGSGTVVSILEADVTIRGFTIRGSGTSLHKEDSGVFVDTGRLTLEDSLIEDVLFGIYVKTSPGSILRNNTVLSKQIGTASQGDGVRIWYSDNTIIENNIASDGRDIILWYSNNSVVRGNQFDRGRYGLHLMYSDQAIIENNSLRENSIGVYIMYSRNSLIKGNSISNNDGPIAAGLGMKDVDGAEIINNRFVNNRIAAQIDNSPREPGIEHYWSGNVFAYNEIALGLMPSAWHNTFFGNSFIDNIENVSILGGGQLREVSWSFEGQGNYWSDYAGYDADGDGIGDLPYRSQQLFENLTDRHPQVRLFLYSPAAMAIDFAARAFPAVQPREKFVDPAPLMTPPGIAGLPPVEQAATSWRLLGGGAGLLAVAGTVLVAGRLRRRELPVESEPAMVNEINNDKPGNPPLPLHMVTVQGLVKRYGKVAAVNDVTFAVPAGEAVAMWGPNGAGKTTIIRCLLGIARFEGDIRIADLDPVRQGKQARAAIGFVPQDLAPSPTPVGELANFVARLKGSTSEDALRQLQRLGIADQVEKPVAALSGGMKQRLSLALALIGQPKVLLLDEPTANLDAAGRASLLQLLGELKRDGMTLIFSSHRPDDVLALADRVLLLERGELRGSLTPAEYSGHLAASSRLVVTLSNGHMHEALQTLDDLGLPVDAEGKVLTITVQPREKARVLSSLTLAGVEIDDFEVERGS